MKNLQTISQIAFQVTHFFENLWLFYVNGDRLVRANEQWLRRVCAHAQGRVHFFIVFFFACDKYPKLTDMAHVPSAEINYKGTNTNLPSMFESVQRVFKY